MIIPRSPSPAPVDEVDEMSLEELRQLARERLADKNVSDCLDSSDKF
jgi:hypothetical protein